MTLTDYGNEIANAAVRAAIRSVRLVDHTGHVHDRCAYRPDENVELRVCDDKTGRYLTISIEFVDGHDRPLMSVVCGTASAGDTCELIGPPRIKIKPPETGPYR